MKKNLFIFIFIFVSQLWALEFKVASYNVENFFDLHYDKTEYKEFIPHTKYWNKSSFHNKLHNISKVIQDLDADIIGLQEIESHKVLKAIIKKNPKYKFFAFLKNPNSAIGIALLSKYKITSTGSIKIDKYDKFSRDILKVELLIKDKPLIIYVNHWRSKRAPESKRIKYALALKNELAIHKNEDYIILGDLNSNYNEYQTFKYDKKLNDTFGITGINQILNTSIDGNFVQKNSILEHQEKIHFNPWLELDSSNKFSARFRNNNNTPDHIILSSTLFDNKNISYINNSFRVFKPKYLFKKNKIMRWNQKKYTGFSDHLPIYAYFSTNLQNYNFKDHKRTSNTISYLYNIQNIKDYRLDNVLVIYRTNKIAILKQTKEGRAIMLYKPPSDIKTGTTYSFSVNKIDTFNGLKEIKKISDIKVISNVDRFKEYYIDGKLIDLQNEKYINDIIYNIKGIYKKRHLYFNNQKIRLYFPKGIKKPEEGKTIVISSGHLSIYKSSMQITLHRMKDFEVY